jgi:tRNA pseudouridine32 synthase / 23S rRNA pseudouridine746 synthase
MPAIVTYLDPPPHAAELPARMPSPFWPGAPHPIAGRCADALAAQLDAGLGARLGLDAPGGGKMFGVLVVRDPRGRVGYLRAFSGMVAGTWHLPGFAPPAFDLAARDAFWPAGEAELAVIDAALRAHDVLAAPARAAHDALAARHAAELAALRAIHRDRRALRRSARAALDPARAAALHDLDQQSRADTAERRRFDARVRAERTPGVAALAALAVERDLLVARRAQRSRELLHAIHATYVLASARGERRELRALFAPAEPPGGAGDCAAPKLLAAAYRDGLEPLAFAERWWGAPPATGGRLHGAFYPACRGKCGPVLAHMLDGLAVEPAPVFGAEPIAADEPHAVYEDAWLLVVAKPAGLLSVPGRHGLSDSVLARLRERYPGATGPLLVHRLDLDTSGLLVAAKDQATHAALARAFARREIDKRYVAWLDGEVAEAGGEIALAMRVDLDDRPRQIVDPVHGREAITAWQVLARAGGRTKVALFPRTGRAHQLRVHAAHPRGIGVPIVGDRLYGRPVDQRSDEADSGGHTGLGRLMLHAEAVSFLHPHTLRRLEIVRPAPF